MMKFGSAQVSRGFGAAVILLTPFWFVATVLMAIAVCHDIFHFTGVMPIALGLTAPAAYLVVRWLVPAVNARLLTCFDPAPVVEAAD